MDMPLAADFWIGLLKIIWINVILSGDNAVVIALACRNLPVAMRRKGVIWGTVGAIVLRIVLIFFAMSLLKLPYLKLIGAVLLLWIGIKLLVPDEEGHGELHASDKLLGAIKTIIVADFVMSVDNVIGIAGAAQGTGHGGHEMALVIFGLLVSIPIIVWGSTLVLKLMDRFPMIITAGGMLLGWIAGTLAVSDPAVTPYVAQDDQTRYVCGGMGAVIVLVLGSLFARRVPNGTA
jgi:YjbE family integral membrane protein